MRELGSRWKSKSEQTSNSNHASSIEAGFHSYRNIETTSDRFCSGNQESQGTRKSEAGEVSHARSSEGAYLRANRGGQGRPLEVVTNGKQQDGDDIVQG